MPFTTYRYHRFLSLATSSFVFLSGRVISQLREFRTSFNSCFNRSFSAASRLLASFKNSSPGRLTPSSLLICAPQICCLFFIAVDSEHFFMPSRCKLSIVSLYPIRSKIFRPNKCTIFSISCKVRPLTQPPTDFSCTEDVPNAFLSPMTAPVNLEVNFLLCR